MPSAVGWSLVENIEGIVSCVPGAKITERVDATHYKGTITVKLGPATVSFKGDIEVVQADPQTRTIRILGKGSDTTGSSGASLDLTATVNDAGPEACELSGRSEVTVTGKVAAFGSRLMNSATDQLLKIVFANVWAKAEALRTPLDSPVDIEAPAAQPARAFVPPAETKFNALAFVWALLKGHAAWIVRRSKAT